MMWTGDWGRADGGGVLSLCPPVLLKDIFFCSKMANAMEDGLEDQFLGDPPEMIPLHRENSAPQYIPAMSSGSSPFVQFKHNCAILASI